MCVRACVCVWVCVCGFVCVSGVRSFSKRFKCVYGHDNLELLHGSLQGEFELSVFVCLYLCECVRVCVCANSIMWQ